MTLAPISQGSQAVGTRSELQVSLIDGSINTYSVSGIISGFVGQTVQINGNSTNVVRVTRIDVSLIAAAAALTSVAVQRTSSPAVGGGATGFSVASNDTNNPAAVSGVNFYTSAPAQGAPVGSPTRSVEVGIAASGELVQVQSWDFGNGPKQGLVLRNGYFLAIVLGANAAGSTMSVTVEWTESAT